MATTIELKNSVTTGNSPSSLAQGETGWNITDKKVWIGNASSTPIQFIGAGASMTLDSLTASTLSSSASTALTLQSAGTTAITVDTSQNVGIGTSSPAAKLNVTGHSSNLIASFNKGATTQGYVRLSNSAQAYDTYVDINNNGSNVWALFDGTGAQYIDSYNPGASGYRAFYTVGTERMRIDSSGNLLVGTTSTNPNPGWFVNPNGYMALGNNAAASGFTFVYFGRSGTGIGSITQAGTTGVLYNITSDYRLKTDVTPIQNALATVEALNPVSFTWTDGRKDDGFLAHEIQAVIPNCVTGEKDAVNEDGTPKYQQMDNSGVIPFLVKAIQEQQALITSLTTRLTALEGK